MANGLAQEYDQLLALAANASAERERIISDTAASVDQKALQDVNRSLQYVLVQLRKNNRRLKRLVSSGVFGKGGISKQLSRDLSPEGLFLKNYLIVFQEAIPSITPDITALASLLRKQTSNKDQQQVLIIEKDIQGHLGHLARIIDGNYRNQFVTLSHHEASGTQAEQHVSNQKTSFWIIVKLIAVMSIYLHSTQQQSVSRRGVTLGMRVKRAGALMSLAASMSPLAIGQMTPPPAPQAAQQRQEAKTAEGQLQDIIKKYNDDFAQSLANFQNAMKKPEYQGDENMREAFAKRVRFYHDALGVMKMATQLVNAYKRYLANPTGKDAALMRPHSEALSSYAMQFTMSADSILRSIRFDALEPGSSGGGAYVADRTKFVDGIAAFSQALQAEFVNRGLAIRVAVSK